jgi:hypothetical protein
MGLPLVAAGLAALGLVVALIAGELERRAGPSPAVAT